MPETFIIDTDMALDDWMAILYLLQSPHADVKVITIAATGETHAKAGSKNALRLTALTQAPIPAVAFGRKTPLKGNHSFPLLVRLLMDMMFFLPLPKPKGNVLRETATQVLKSQLQNTKEKLQILSIGPMTNLAEVLIEAPQLVEKIGTIYQMGGALNVHGNLSDINKSIDNPYAEWNIYIDPYAANVVFRSGAAITLIPLDTTNHAPLTEDYIAKFKAENQHPTTNFVLKEMQRIFPLMREDKFYFWDVLAAVVATHPQIAEFEIRKLRVIDEEGRESGRIVEDPNGSEIRVCTHIDEDAFKRIFLDTLNQKQGV